MSDIKTVAKAETKPAEELGERELVRVNLEMFSGPLDLLLYLIRKMEVDIYDLKVAAIADQYGAYVETLQALDIDAAADFIEVYSTLIEIKSRLVLPKPVVEEEAGEGEEEEDPHSRLIRQLLEYKEFKDRSMELEERELAMRQRFARLLPQEVPGEKMEPLKDVSLWDLIQAFGKILSQIAQEAPRRIRMDSTPVKIHIEHLRNLVETKKSLNFFELFRDKIERTEVVGLFIAILELVRLQVMRCEQELNFQDIWLVFIPPEERDLGDSQSIEPTTSTS